MSPLAGYPGHFGNPASGMVLSRKGPCARSGLTTQADRCRGARPRRPIASWSHARSPAFGPAPCSAFCPAAPPEGLEGRGGANPPPACPAGARPTPRSCCPCAPARGLRKPPHRQTLGHEIHGKACGYAERSGSPTPGQRCSIVNRDAIPAFGAAGLFGSRFIGELFRRQRKWKAAKLQTVMQLVARLPSARRATESGSASPPCKSDPTNR